MDGTNSIVGAISNNSNLSFFNNDLSEINGINNFLKVKLKSSPSAFGLSKVSNLLVMACEDGSLYSINTNSKDIHTSTVLNDLVPKAIFVEGFTTAFVEAKNNINNIIWVCSSDFTSFKKYEIAGENAIAFCSSEDGTVYIGCISGRIYQVRKLNDNWDFSVTKMFLGGLLAISCENGTLRIIDRYGNLIGLDRKSGNKSFDIKLPRPDKREIVRAAFAIYSNKLVYYLQPSEDFSNKIYTYNLDTGADRSETVDVNVTAFFQNQHGIFAGGMTGNIEQILTK